MKFHPLSFAFLLPLILFACTNTQVETIATIEEMPVLPALLEIDLEKIKAAGSLAAAKIIEVPYDPVFKRTKKYEAIPLTPYLEKLIQVQNLDTANTEIIFLCKDGYNPAMSLAKVRKHSPYLAIKDLEATKGQQWMDTLSGKWTPFYLVWTDYPDGANGFAWPYGLKFLQFKASQEAYKAAFPIDKAMISGFELYQSKCMKCHSINKVGGVMGPEFNIPKNITEYWKKEDIIAFVKNPSSYRYNSKMPPVEGITDTELAQILAYLEYMKGYKL